MSDLQTIIDDIRSAHRERNFAMETRKRADLALGAYLRIQLGWRRPVDDKEAEALGMTKVAKADLLRANKNALSGAAAIIEAAEAYCSAVGKEHDRSAARKDYTPKVIVYPTVPGFDQFGAASIASIESRGPMIDVEDAARKRMETLALQLPVWPEFGEPIKGFGACSLAVIVAEAGNLSKYANPGKLWRRMGLAPHVGDDGKDHLPSSLRKMKLSKAEWEIIKYSPSRRSRMFVIADSLLKQQSEYRDLFLERRAYEHRKAEAACLIPATEMKVTVEGWAANGLPPLTLVKKLDPDVHASAGHMTAKARVYVEKRLLKNLWRTWRRLEGLSYEEPIEMQNAA